MLVIGWESNQILTRQELISIQAYLPKAGKGDDNMTEKTSS